MNKLIKIFYSFSIIMIAFISSQCMLAALGNDSCYDLSNDIERINNDIRRIANMQKRDYQSASDTISDSYSKCNSYNFQLNSLNDRFLYQLSEYKPSCESWSCFDPIAHHCINRNSRFDMEYFYDEIRKIRNNLKDLQGKMRDLKCEIENKSRETVCVKKTVKRVYRPAPVIYREERYCIPEPRYIDPFCYRERVIIRPEPVRSSAGFCFFSL